MPKVSKKGGKLYVSTKALHKKHPHTKKTVKSKKEVAKIAKKVVINQMEMRRRETGILNIEYLDGVLSEGAPEEVFKGLNGRNPCNFVLNPLNYGWENDQSSPTSEHFIGKSITPRFLKTKLLFKFPSGDNCIREAMRVQLIWGFIKRPQMLTHYTTPKSTEVTINQLKVAALHQVEGQFDSEADQLKFHVKRPNNFIITGRRWVRPDRRHRIGLPQQYAFGAVGAQQPYIEGGPPDVKEVISWKMGKEWRLQKSGSLADNPDGAGVFWYNNESWQPFFVVYNPDFGNVRQAPENYSTPSPPGRPELEYPPGGGEDGEPVPEANRIQVEHNSCIWYNDG